MCRCRSRCSYNGDVHDDEDDGGDDYDGDVGDDHGDDGDDGDEDGAGDDDDDEVDFTCNKCNIY